jgi:hypothetical protein
VKALLYVHGWIVSVAVVVVAFALMVKDVEESIDAIVVPTGIPAPSTTMPTDSAATVETLVTEALPELMFPVIVDRDPDPRCAMEKPPLASNDCATASPDVGAAIVIDPAPLVIETPVPAVNVASV